MPTLIYSWSSKTQRKLKATVNRCTYAYIILVKLPQSHQLNVAYEKFNLIISLHIKQIFNVFI